jgi:hypothetical protein
MTVSKRDFIDPRGLSMRGVCMKDSKLREKQGLQVRLDGKGMGTEDNEY